MRSSAGWGRWRSSVAPPGGRSPFCPRCGGLTSSASRTCPLCGLRLPGRVNLGALATALFRPGAFVRLVMIASGVLFALSLLLDPPSGGGAFDPFRALTPSTRALAILGASGAFPWHVGRWWSLLTATYLHGGLLHIAFNMLWFHRLGPEVEAAYGPARLVVIFTLSGIACFAVSSLAGTTLTLGSSGAIFGLLGALVAFGRKHGGYFGRVIVRQYAVWALLMFVFGFLMPGVDNFGHGGGFVGGLLAGFALGTADRRAEGGGARLAAAACVALTLLAFGLSAASLLGG